MKNDIIIELLGYCDCVNDNLCFDCEITNEIKRLRLRVDYWNERCLRAEECVQFLQNKKWWQR